METGTQTGTENGDFFLKFEGGFGRYPNEDVLGDGKQQLFEVSVQHRILYDLTALLPPPDVSVILLHFLVYWLIAMF